MTTFSHPSPHRWVLQTGQVSFHNPADVKKYVVLEEDKETLRRLRKTEEERYPDLAAERDARDKEEKEKLRAEARLRSKAEKELEEKRCVGACVCGRERRGGIGPTGYLRC